MKKQQASSFGAWLKRSRASLLVLLAAALLFAAVRLSLREASAEQIHAGDYAEYEKGTVVTVLSDSSFADEASDGGFRGEQQLLVDVKSGQYSGKQLLVQNFVGPLYGVPVREGDGVALIISTYSDGRVMATVFEYNRIPGLVTVLLLFFAVTLLVGRKTGAKSLLALVITVLCLFYILLPLLHIREHYVQSHQDAE